MDTFRFTYVGSRTVIGMYIVIATESYRLWRGQLRWAAMGPIRAPVFEVEATDGDGKSWMREVAKRRAGSARHVAVVEHAAARERGAVADGRALLARFLRRGRRALVGPREAARTTTAVSA